MNAAASSESWLPFSSFQQMLPDLLTGQTSMNVVQPFLDSLSDTATAQSTAEQYLSDQVMQGIFSTAMNSIFGEELNNKVIRQIAEGGWQSVDAATRNQWNQAVRTQQLKDLMPYSSYQQEILNAYNGAENGNYSGITSMVTGLTNAAETDHLLDKYLQHEKLSDEEYRTLASS